MSDKMLDILILALVGWLVYDRMQQKKVVSVSTPVVLTKEQEVAALLAAE